MRNLHPVGGPPPRSPLCSTRFVESIYVSFITMPFSGATRRRVRRAIQFVRTYNRIDFFPIRSSLHRYSRQKAHGDIRAGLNVALLAFPQGMAYASIAGLPIEYGVYGSAVAAIVGPIFSGSRFIMLGPTNATSVLLFTTFLALDVAPAEKIALVPTLLLMVGFFLVLGAILRVANLIQYVSRTVVTGYITAAAPISSKRSRSLLSPSTNRHLPTNIRSPCTGDCGHTRKLWTSKFGPTRQTTFTSTP